PGGHRGGPQRPPGEVAVAGQPEDLQLPLGLLGAHLWGLPHPPPVGADRRPLHFPEGHRPVHLPDPRRVYLYGGRGLLNVSRIIVHPNYVAAHLGFDLALLRLATRVGAASNVQPVTLPPEALNFTPEDECWLTGWGRTSYYTPLHPPYRLQQVHIPLEDHEACEEGYKEYLHASADRTVIPEDMLCAGSLGRGPCMGDSGGPLVCRKRGSWVQVGVVSWGIGCSTIQLPAVFTSVQSHVAWIRREIRKCG
uniref:Peptidase S1 domain-containing protein n=1 Tax=Cercocebus atys TaxID=9531 RepID=A0A2K5MUS7_CERAT